MHSTTEIRSTRRIISLLSLIVAGEAIFFLPFVIARVFRPTMLEVFGITNLELGFAFSAYGVVAMIAYFPGGPLADLFPPRKLMATALLSTGLGGLFMATFPTQNALKLLYAFWGLTTILLFWAALMRATRQLGGESLSGTAFGILDGGRGLVAAVSSSIAVVIYGAMLPGSVQTASLAQRTDAFEMVIFAFTGFTIAVAILVWFCVPNPSDTEVSLVKIPGNAFSSTGVLSVLRLPAVWLQALIVVCAYVGYKGLDDLSLYAKEVLGFDEVSAAYTSTVSMWVRPAAAISAGLIADRFRVSTVSAICFALMAIGCGFIASDTISSGMTVLFFVSIVATSAAVFALRGLYFAIMQEGQIPFHYTGTAVGIVSALGFTPDIFMGPLMGKLLDDYPGVLGHQRVFLTVAIFACCGFIATLMFRRLSTTADR